MWENYMTNGLRIESGSLFLRSIAGQLILWLVFSVLVALPGVSQIEACWFHLPRIICKYYPPYIYNSYVLKFNIAIVNSYKHMVYYVSHDIPNITRKLHYTSQ